MKAGIDKVKLTEREQMMLDALNRIADFGDTAYSPSRIAKKAIESVTGKSIEESIK